MTAGPTALDVFADAFRQNVESMTGGAVKSPPLPERYARSGTRGRPAGAGRPGRLHGLRNGNLGKRGSQAAGVRFPVPLARLGSRAPGNRLIAGRVGSGLSGVHRTDAAAGLGRLLRLPARHHPQPRHRRAAAAGRAEDPHDPVGDLRQGGGADGGEPDPDGLRRGLHVAADRRHRRLRARCEHHARAALFRGRALHGAHPSHRRRARPLGIVGVPGAAASRCSGGARARGTGGVGLAARDGRP